MEFYFLCGLTCTILALGLSIKYIYWLLKHSYSRLSLQKPSFWPFLGKLMGSMGKGNSGYPPLLSLLTLHYFQYVAQRSQGGGGGGGDKTISKIISVLIGFYSHLYFQSKTLAHLICTKHNFAHFYQFRIAIVWGKLPGCSEKKCIYYHFLKLYGT